MESFLFLLQCPHRFELHAHVLVPARRARQRRVELTRHFVGLRRLEPKRLQECYLDLLLKKNDIWDYDHFGESSWGIVATFPIHQGEWALDG